MKDDTISRSAAIDAVEHITSSMSVCLNRDECHGMKRMQRQAVLELANMPSAQQERKKGKWLPDNNNYYEERFICSVCGKSYKVDTCMGKPMWDFCPCGADMMEDGDGNG